MNKARLLLLACAAALAAGCGGAPSDSILIAGSSTFIRQTKKLSEGFMKANPGVTVVPEGGGSYAGLIAVRRGAINIAVLSRDMADNMDDDRVKGYLTAKDGIAIVVHPSNTVRTLTVAQVRDIFSGRIKDWSRVGGKKGPITVIGRLPGSTSREGFETMVLCGFEVRRDAREAPSAEAMNRSVSAAPGAIGYVSTHTRQPGIKYLEIEGVPVSRQTILSGRYPLSRSLYFVIAQHDPDDEGDLDAHRERVQWTRRFIAYSQSREGQAILEKEGLYPVY